MRQLGRQDDLPPLVAGPVTAVELAGAPAADLAQRHADGDGGHLIVAPDGAVVCARPLEGVVVIEHIVEGRAVTRVQWRSSQALAAWLRAEHLLPSAPRSRLRRRYLRVKP